MNFRLGLSTSQTVADLLRVVKLEKDATGGLEQPELDDGLHERDRDRAIEVEGSAVEHEDRMLLPIEA